MFIDDFYNPLKLALNKSSKQGSGASFFFDLSCGWSGVSEDLLGVLTPWV